MKVDQTNAMADYHNRIEHTVKVLRETLDKYEPNEIFLSFNGGKDCTVLLHLFGELFAERYPDVKLFCLYIQPNNPFDEIEEFIGDCRRRYGIEVETIRGSVKGALFEMCQQHPQLKACVMGCRRTDPYCNDLNDFQTTDQGWPPLMRVNPLLEWTCKDVWTYLHESNVPYCSLYAKGYTSIGDRQNTKPNPHLLRRNTETGKEEYLHADQLTDHDEFERSGRF